MKYSFKDKNFLIKARWSVSNIVYQIALKALNLDFCNEFYSCCDNYLGSKEALLHNHYIKNFLAPRSKSVSKNDNFQVAQCL